MPPSRAEIVRRAVAAFAGHGVEAMLDYVSEDVVFQEDPAWLDGGTWHGREGVRELFRQRLESTAIEPEIEELPFDGPLIARVDAFIDPDQARARFDR